MAKNDKKGSFLVVYFVFMRTFALDMTSLASH